MAAKNEQSAGANGIESSAMPLSPNIKSDMPKLSFSGAYSGQSLVPYMEFMVDPSGIVSLEELFSPSYDSTFTPLEDGIPLTDTGSTWLRLSVIPNSNNNHVIALGSELASDAILYVPEFEQYINNIEQFSLNQSGSQNGLATSTTKNKANIATPWQKISFSRGEALSLPNIADSSLLTKLQSHSLPVYIHMAGTPEPWFTPQLHDTTYISNNTNNLIHLGISAILAAILILSLLRAFIAKGQWRLWTIVFTTALLIQSLVGLPTTPHGSIGLAGLPHVLAPTIALMLLPHIARHMLRKTTLQSNETSTPHTDIQNDLSSGTHASLDSDLDRQYRFLSIPCILLGIVPLLPNMAWLGKVLPLWPLLILFFLPTTLIAITRQIDGAKLFLFGCLLAILGACGALVAMFMNMPTTYIHAIPLCGAGLGALVIAGVSTKRTQAHSQEAPKALKKHKTSITIREDYDDPLAGESGLRLLSPQEVSDGVLGVVSHHEATNTEQHNNQALVMTVENSSTVENSHKEDTVHTEELAAKEIKPESIVSEEGITVETAISKDTAKSEEIVEPENKAEFEEIAVSLEEVMPEVKVAHEDKKLQAHELIQESPSTDSTSMKHTPIDHTSTALTSLENKSITTENTKENTLDFSPELSINDTKTTLAENIRQENSEQKNSDPQGSNPTIGTQESSLDIETAPTCAMSTASSKITIKQPSLSSCLREPLDQEDLHVLVRAEEAMRYPLESLRNSIKSLKNCSTNPDTLKLCQEAEAASKQLDFAGEEFRRATYRLPVEQDSTIFDLQRCLRDAYDNVCPRSDAKNVALSWFMAPHLVQTYQGDAERLRTTLRMLMESAVDATDKGSVYLSARRVPDSTNPGHLLFTITDTGAAGPPERRKASALMQAWELATSTGGSLSIDSGIHGTTISFSTRFLAIHSDNNQIHNVELQRISSCVAYGDHMISSPTAGAKHGRIILGAPAASNRQLLAFYLEDTAYFADEALSNLDIMAKYTSAGAELIILDGDMVDAEITKIITTIRQFEQENDLPPVPFLALVRDEKHADALLHMGCTQTLLKPVTRSGLCAQVALLAPLVVIPPATEYTSKADCDTNTEAHDKPCTESSSPMASSPDAFSPDAFSPDMDNSALANAIEHLAVPSIGSDVRSEVPSDANTQGLSPENIQYEENTLEKENLEKHHAETHVVENEALIDEGLAQKSTDIEESKNNNQDSRIDAHLTSDVDDEHLNAPAQDELAQTAPTHQNTPDVTQGSCQNSVPTSEAEDITLRIYDEYLQGGKSTISPSMLDLDPILFTDICPMTGKKAVNKKSAHSKKIATEAKNTTKDVRLQKIPDVSHELMAKVSPEPDLLPSMESDEAKQAFKQGKAPILADIAESVSEPRTVIKKVVQNPDTQESTVFIEHVQAKVAAQTLAPEESTRTASHKDTPHKATSNSASSDSSSEVYVEEVTVGTEKLRLYKMPSTSLDPDAEYAAMLEREAKHLREKENKSHEEQANQDLFPTQAKANEANDALPIAIKPVEEEPSAEAVPSHANTSNRELAPDAEKVPHSEAKAEAEKNSEIQDTSNNLAHDNVDKNAHSSQILHTEEMSPVLVKPIVEEEAIYELNEKAMENPRDTIYSDDKHGEYIKLDEYGHTDEYEELSEYDEADEYDETDAYDEADSAQDNNGPSPVARVAAALGNVCASLREPAPVRLKEKTLPSLRNLYKAFGTNIKPTDTMATADLSEAVAPSFNPLNKDMGHNDRNSKKTYGGKLAKEKSHEDMAMQEQGQRFVSIAQTVSEMAANIKSTPPALRQSNKKDFVPQLISFLDTSLQEANTAYEQGDVRTMQNTATGIADNAEALGLRNLARYARCVEYAARANDLASARELYPDMENVVQRTITALRTSGIDGAHRA